jgi:hypothetical protein
MDLFERYLGSIAVLLPADQRDDIIAELRDALSDQREETEARNGHPLTREETTALLRAFGHPIAVAGRYGRQQYLIGPELYPVYVFVLKLVLAIIAGSALITGIVTATVTAAVNPGHAETAVRTAIAILWNGSFTSVGVVTVIFAVLQRRNTPLKFLDQWNPRDLPKTPKRRRDTWVDHVAAIVVQTVFLLWWSGAIHFGQPPIALRGGQTLRLDLAPVWQALYWPIVGLSAATLLMHALKLTGLVRRRLGGGLDLVVQVITLAIAGFAMRAGHWVEVSGSGLPAKSLAAIGTGADISIQITLVCVIVVAACTAVLDLWRLYRQPSPN